MIEFKEVYQTNHMRIGNPTKNEYFLKLNEINQQIQDQFIVKIKNTTRTVTCNVMLGDSTTKEIDTFDITNVNNFLSDFTNISNWSSQGMSNSSDEDLRRLFTKSEIKLETIFFRFTYHYNIVFSYIINQFEKFLNYKNNLQV